MGGFLIIGGGRTSDPKPCPGRLDELVKLHPEPLRLQTNNYFGFYSLQTVATLFFWKETFEGFCFDGFGVWEIHFLLRWLSTNPQDLTMGRFRGYGLGFRVEFSAMPKYSTPLPSKEQRYTL